MCHWSFCKLTANIRKHWKHYKTFTDMKYVNGFLIFKWVIYQYIFFLLISANKNDHVNPWNNLNPLTVWRWSFGPGCFLFPKFISFYNNVIFMKKFTLNVSRLKMFTVFWLLLPFFHAWFNLRCLRRVIMEIFKSRDF